MIMFFLITPINGFLAILYFLIFHTNYLLILLLLAVMGIIEWRDKQIDYVDDERKMI